MEMIAAQAFRLRSHQTLIFRRWLTPPPRPRMLVVKVADDERETVN